MNCKNITLHAGAAWAPVPGGTGGDRVGRPSLPQKIYGGMEYLISSQSLTLVPPKEGDHSNFVTSTIENKITANKIL